MRNPVGFPFKLGTTRLQEILLETRAPRWLDSPATRSYVVDNTPAEPLS